MTPTACHSAHRRRSRFGASLIALVSTLTLAFGGGCSSKTYLMPTPTIYTHADWNPFEDVPESLQGDTVSVLYITDRTIKEKKQSTDPFDYGHGRSRSIAFGEANVTMGQEQSWDAIVEASRAEKRRRDLELRMSAPTELGRFGMMPPHLVITDAQMASGQGPTPDPADVEAGRLFQQELSARLARSPKKHVFIYVHGFNNTFENAVLTTAELWHFLGREGVPVCYTWPAGVGVLRAYEYTVASTEFTISHLKRMLRMIAANPDVERIHILAHSRGTAVLTDTIRELHIELRSTTDSQQALKLGTVILAAADIDLDVAISRNATERIGRAAERSALYIHDKDGALGFSQWLFGGMRRLGNADPTIFSEEELETLRRSVRFQLIDARVKKAGGFGHAYFHANPAVSSDVVLLMRYGLAPGEQHGRPLGVSDAGLWAVDDEYPGTDWSPSATAGTPQ